MVEESATAIAAVAEYARGVASGCPELLRHLSTPARTASGAPESAPSIVLRTTRVGASLRDESELPSSLPAHCGRPCAGGDASTTSANGLLGSLLVLPKRPAAKRS